MVLLDHKHDEVGLEEIINGLGGEIPNCINCFIRWKRNEDAGSEAALYKASAKRRDLAIARRINRIEKVDPLTRPIECRAAFIAKLLGNGLRKAGIPKPGFAPITITCGDDIVEIPFLEYDRSKPPVRLIVPKYWHSNVWSQHCFLVPPGFLITGFSVNKIVQPGEEPVLGVGKWMIPVDKDVGDYLYVKRVSEIEWAFAKEEDVPTKNGQTPDKKRFYTGKI